MAAPQTSRQPAARGGFTLIELLVVIAIIGVLLALTLAAVQAARAAAARADCQNRMRQIGLATHQYHDAHHRLPPGCDTRGELLHMSWLTRLLPYLEQRAGYDQALRDYARQPLFSFPLDGHAGMSSPMAAFTCPTTDRQVGRYTNVYLGDEPFPVAFTWYQGVSGRNSVVPDGVLFADSRVRFADVTDGQSNTLLAGERPPSPDDSLGWWYAGAGQRGMGGSADFYLGVREYPERWRLPMCPSETGVFRLGRSNDLCDVLHFWSRHPGGANFVFVDASVHFLRYSADPLLPALSTRNCGEVTAVD